MKPTVEPLISNGNHTQSGQEAAEIFQKFCKSVNVREEAGVLPSFPDRADDEGNEDLNEDVVFNPGDVELMLKSRNMEKAAGPDTILSILLNKCAEHWLSPYSSYVGKPEMKAPSHMTGKQLKLCQFIKRTITRAEYYRPVSLTSQVSKAMGKLIKKGVTSHLTRSKTLTEC